MVKKILSLFSLFVSCMSVSAQSTEPGQDYYYYKRYSAAESFFHEYLQHQPSSAGAWLWLVKSYMQEGKFQEARDSLSLAPASLYNDPYYLVAKGIGHLSENVKDSALLYFNRAIDLTKGRNPAIMNEIAGAQLLQVNGNMSFAIEVLQKALKKAKNNSGLYLTMGDVYFSLHNGTEAFKAYRNALEKDENNAAAYYQLGRIFVSQNNSDVYLDYFKKAIAADKKYAPAYYELYNYYRYKEPSTAMTYFQEYARLSDKSVSQDYAYTDLLYLNKDYSKAVDQARTLIKREGKDVQPRLYKLIGYSYAELKDTANALVYMQDYFRLETDSNLIVKDFETMAAFYNTREGMEDSVMVFYKKAINRSEDTVAKRNYYKTLAVLSNNRKDYEAEAEWRNKFYSNNDKATNIDLFNWGIAAYRAEDYPQADSVFGLYTDKYADQGFGYYWRARSNAAIDTTLKEGLAIPYYEKLVAMLANDTLTASNKKWMLEAYSYLAAYETNTEKDYEEAIGYFDKILEIDPENDAAKKYIAILEQNVKKQETSN